MRILLLVLSVAASVLFAPPVWSAERVTTQYLEPKNKTQLPIMQKLKQRRVLETLQELLSAIQLPRPLLLQTKDCEGVSNAWYEDNVITMCYEFVAEIYVRAPMKPTDAGVSHEDVVVGTLVQVLLHETGHAMFDMLRIPIFGREEDAADQFAAYLVLQMHREDARRVIDGVSQMLLNQASVQKVDRDAFSNIHGLPAQRYFNLMCMAYGAHSWLYADIVSKGLLPEERAESCKAEYKSLVYAMDTLILPHVDPESRDKFKSTLRDFRMPDLDRQKK